jgi:hypothetical protein
MLGLSICGLDLSQNFVHFGTPRASAGQCALTRKTYDSDLAQTVWPAGQ